MEEILSKLNEIQNQLDDLDGKMVEAHITDAEFGTWSLDELESYTGAFGLGIERDLHFRPMSVRELKTKYNIEW